MLERGVLILYNLHRCRNCPFQKGATRGLAVVFVVTWLGARRLWRNVARALLDATVKVAACGNLFGCFGFGGSGHSSCSNVYYDVCTLHIDTTPQKIATVLFLYGTYMFSFFTGSQFNMNFDRSCASCHGAPRITPAIEMAAIHQTFGAHPAGPLGYL